LWCNVGVTEELKKYMVKAGKGILVE
jgi:hypothetical protein